MKLHHVQITEGDRTGGLAGPTPHLRDLLTYTPDSEFRGKLIQIIESHSDHEGQKPIYDWCWKTDEWVPSSVKLSVVFGATCPPLAEQLVDFDFDEEKIAHWQKDADAITRLTVRGILTEGDADRARKKLINRIAKGE